MGNLQSISLEHRQQSKTRTSILLLLLNLKACCKHCILVKIEAGQLQQELTWPATTNVQWKAVGSKACWQIDRIDRPLGTASDPEGGKKSFWMSTRIKAVLWRAMESDICQQEWWVETRDGIQLIKFKCYEKWGSGCPDILIGFWSLSTQLQLSGQAQTTWEWGSLSNCETLWKPPGVVPDVTVTAADRVSSRLWSRHKLIVFII